MATLQLYGKLGANVFGGEVSGDAAQMDYLSDTVRATLHNNTYVPNIDVDEAFTDATNELSTANGYTANGVALASKTTSYNATGNVTTYSAAAFSWTAAGGSLVFRYVVFHDDTVSTGPPAKPLLGYIDVTGSGNFTLNDTLTFTVTPGGNGLWTATVT